MGNVKRKEKHHEYRVVSHHGGFEHLRHRGLAVSPDDSTNHPAVFPNTGKPIPLADASRTNNNAALPPMSQGTISNLHDKIGTNAVNHGNDNPDIQAPHTPPQ